jgi:hypothetical protein
VNRLLCPRNSYRALVIGLFLACCWPTLALADCGWIIWLKTTRLELDRDSKGIVEPGVWEPRQGFALFAECRAASTVERKSNKDLEVPVVGGGILRYTYEVACFPGEFDPRPRPKSN